MNEKKKPLCNCHDPKIRVGFRGRDYGIHYSIIFIFFPTIRKGENIGPITVMEHLAEACNVVQTRIPELIGFRVASLMSY